jgi:D-alanyl-D-alanine carboxypeptidase
VIERASGDSYRAFVTDRLLQPLGLNDTYVAESGDEDANLVQSYDEAGNALTVDPSYGWAAGAIVSTPRDLARWGAALFGGDVVSPSSLETMVTPLSLADANDYGHGVFVESDGGEALYGHTGGIGGFQTYLYHWKTDDVTLVAASNVKGVELRALAGYGWSALGIGDD